MIAVRYFSQGGNTKKIAEAIAEGAGTTAVSVTDAPALTERADVLFLGGAPYANIMAPALKAYAEALSPDKVGRAALFTTSNWSRRTVLALKKQLKANGIAVEEEFFYAHRSHIDENLEAARVFGNKYGKSRKSEEQIN